VATGYQAARSALLIPNFPDNRSISMAKTDFADTLTVVNDQEQKISDRLAALAARREEMGVPIGRLAKQAGYKTSQSWYDLMAKDRPVTTLEKFERALDYIEEHAHEAEQVAATSTPEGMMEFEVTGDFGVRVIVRGPVSNADELERAAAKILRDMRAGRED
jgi:hypothetical protein